MEAAKYELYDDLESAYVVRKVAAADDELFVETAEEAEKVAASKDEFSDDVESVDVAAKLAAAKMNFPMMSRPQMLPENSSNERLVF